MAKRKGNVFGQTVVYERTYKGTSLGRHPITSTMNKNKRRLRGKSKNRGQGRWSGLTSILMVSLFLLECHKILDHHKAREAVVLVQPFQESMDFVLHIGLEVWKILMFVVNGDLEPYDETCNDNNIVSYILWRY